ncbi:MAG: MBOAT family O-acyltransferase [Flavobacteriales bacterium]|jgi:alginate O-acetyltransferase complex protein AlgI|nr:MBOAT family protein [Flavobacteriales bacterium]
MLFNTVDYLIFLPLVLVMYHLIPKAYRWVMLLAVSYYFYMCWKPFFAVFMLISTLVDYWAAMLMEDAKDQKTKRRWMAASLVVNLGLLFFFKYMNFFAYNAEVVLGKFNIFYDSPVLDIILPLGISFYTFQSLSYTFDVFKGKDKAERHFGYFALYVSYFPQLVAGPIERAGHLIPQLRNHVPASQDDVKYAINKILLGYFKKVVVADNLAPFVDQLYGNVPSASGLQYAIAAVLFTVQLFCDFSGYTDIAMGSARLMGVRLMDNFNRPFLATNLNAAWAGWHISLTTWIGDYVYRPWVRSAPRKAWIITICTFVLIGFWHGPTWNFVMFGLFHGVAMVLQRMYIRIKPLQPFNDSAPMKVFWMLWNSSLIVFSCIFFRNNVTDAFAVIHHIFTDFHISMADLRSGYFAEMVMGLFFATLAISTALFPRSMRFKYDNLYVVGMLLVIFIFGSDARNQFIYFQF